MIPLRLILPEGLVERALETGLQGWLEGWGIRAEFLGVVTACSIEEGERVIVPAVSRLLDHWARMHGEYDEHLIQWVEVEPGTKDAIRKTEVKTRAQLEARLKSGTSLDLEDGEFGAFCLLERSETGAIEHLVIVNPDDLILSGNTEVIMDEPKLPSRLEGLRSIDELHDKSVAIVGLGSGGSEVALQLAAAGVGTLHLFDSDYIEVDNLFRHVCDLRHVGRSKVNAVSDVVKLHNLTTKTVPHEVNVVSNSNKIWEVIEEVNVVVGATDNVRSRKLLNYACVHTKTPLVLGCSFDNAQIGEIIRVIPGVSACYECTRILLVESGALEKATTEEPEVRYGSDNSQKRSVFSQGTRVDVTLVAALHARVVINTLLAGKEAGNGDLPSNYIAWGVTPNMELPIPFRFKLPFSVNWQEFERTPDCPVCSALDVPLESSTMDQYEEIMEATRKTDSRQRD